MLTFLELLNVFQVDRYILSGTMLLAFLMKLGIFVLCVRYAIQSTRHRLLPIFLICFLMGAILDDICYLIDKIFVIKGELPSFTFLNRLTWAFFITQCQSIALFYEYLAEKRIKFDLGFILTTSINVIVSVCFLYLGFFKYAVPSSSPDTLYFEIKLVQIAYSIVPFIFFFTPV